VKDNQAFESIDKKYISVNSNVMFTFEVDPVTGVMSVLNGHRAVVFPEALQQLDDTDATLVKICQISCGNQKSQPLSRLHVMHDAWCVQAVFEEARFTLLRSMHELIMRCSSLATVEQTARGMNNLLAARSHWDLSCDDQSYPLLSVMLQAQIMIMRSQMIDRTLVAQILTERSLCSELISVLGAQIDILDPEANLQRMCGLRMSSDNGSSRSCTLAPGHIGAGDIGSGNTACRVFQLFSILDDAADCVCDLRHITSSCLEFAVAMEASRFALDAMHRVHFEHHLQQLPTLDYASASSCSVRLLDICDNPVLMSFVCKSAGAVASDGFLAAMGAAFESLRLREALLDSAYRSSVLRRVLKTVLDSSGVAEAIKAERSGFSTKPRKEREPPAIKAPNIALAAPISGPLSLCLSPLSSKLCEVSFESLTGLRALASEKVANQGMETLRVALICELSEAYVLEALVTHSQLAIDVEWRNIACKQVMSKSKLSRAAFGSDDVKLPCNWAGGGLRGVFPSSSAISVATALYSRERILFNAMATLSFEAPAIHGQAVSALHLFCAAFVAEADLPLLIAQCALQTSRLAMKLTRLPPKCSPIIASFVEQKIKSSSQSATQIPDERRTFSSQGDLVDIFVLPSIFQWLKPVCNSATILNHYLCAVISLSDLLSLVHVRAVVVSESSVGDAMVGLFHKISTEISDRKTKCTSAELAQVLQLRCHAWLVKHTMLLKAAQTIMLQNDDYRNARRILTATFHIENRDGMLDSEDVTNDDGGSLSIVEHMHSRPSLGFLDDELVLTPFAERSMLGNEYTKIDFAANAHITSIVKSVNVVEIARQEFEFLRMQLSAVDVRDGLVSLRSGRPRPETKQQLLEATEIIENYVRQQLGVQMSDLGPEDFVVKLVSRTNVLLLRKYLLEIGGIYDKVSQFEAEIQAASENREQHGDVSSNELQAACAALLSCLSHQVDAGEAASGTKVVSASHLNHVLANFAHALFKQSLPSDNSSFLSDLSEVRARIDQLILEQEEERIKLNGLNERFLRLYVCQMLDKACTHIYKEHAYAKQLHRLRKVIDTKTSAVASHVQSIYNPVVKEIDSQNQTRRAGLFKDCKGAMVAYSKTISACFREASVVASNCHMPGQRLIRKPPTPFPDHAASQASSQVVFYSERLHPIEYPNLVHLLKMENTRMEAELVSTRAFLWWKRLVAINRSAATIDRDLAEKDKITKDRFGITIPTRLY
jgi:hypothetical protein